MTVTYTFDAFSSLDGCAAADGAGTSYRASRDPSCPSTAWPCTARSGGSSRGQHLSGVRHDAGLQHRGSEIPNADWMRNRRKARVVKDAALAGVEQLRSDRRRRRPGGRASEARERQRHPGETAAACSSGRIGATSCSMSFGSSCTRSSWAPGSVCSRTGAHPFHSPSPTRRHTPTGSSP